MKARYLSVGTGAARPTTLARRRKGCSGLPAPYNELQCGEAQFLIDYHNYYLTRRGDYGRAVNSGNAWTITTQMSFMNVPILH